MTAFTTIVTDIMTMLIGVVQELFGLVTEIPESGVGFGHFFFIGVTIGLVLVATNLIKRFVWGA